MVNVKIAFRVLLFSALAWAGQALGATAGVVQFVAGDVRVILAGGSERPASKGSPVDVGDTIATAKASMAQIKMGDGAIVVVQPESRVTVAEYHYTGVEDGTEKVQFRLEEGGIRTLTGAIGHTHKANYSIDTPIAHIGVRGTDHESYYFPAGRPGDGDGANAGVYNKVNTGLTYIRTEAGEVEIAPNQVGYVASAHDLPRLLTAVPDFFNRSIQPKVVQLGVGTQVAASAGPSAAAGRGAEASEARRNGGAEGRREGAEGRGERSRHIDLAVTTTNGMDLTDPQITTLAGATVPASIPTGNGVSFGGSVLNPDISPNGAMLVDQGGDAQFGVKWGTWQGGLATVNGAATTGSTHFITSMITTTPAQLASLGPNVVKADYEYVGGPAPTDQLGNAGTINKLQVGVNFSTQQITNYAVSASAGGMTMTGNGSGTISQFTGSSGIALSNGTCTGCTSGSPTPQGTANGAFVGSAAERMITSFGLKAANQAIAGVGYLSRQ